MENLKNWKLLYHFYELDTANGVDGIFKFKVCRSVENQIKRYKIQKIIIRHLYCTNFLLVKLDSCLLFVIFFLLRLFFFYLYKFLKSSKLDLYGVMNVVESVSRSTTWSITNHGTRLRCQPVLWCRRKYHWRWRENFIQLTSLFIKFHREYTFTWEIFRNRFAILFV